MMAASPLTHGHGPVTMVLYDGPVVATTYAMPTREDPRNVRARVERRSAEGGAAAQELDCSAEPEGAMSGVLRDGPIMKLILEKLEPDTASRHAASEVCVDWCAVDGRFRRQVTVANCYSSYPERLTERFPRLKVIKLKCRPRAFEFQQLVPKWGGHAAEWIEAIARQYKELESLHLKRAVVTDQDLECLAVGCGATLRELVLNKCDGFSAKGLASIATHCGCLRILSMIGSHVGDLRGEWLQLLAQNNPHLTVLVLPDPDPAEPDGDPDMDRDDDDDAEDTKGPELSGLEALVKKCPSLRQVTLGPWKKQADVADILAMAPAITELGTGIITDADFGGMLPDRLTTLTGLYDMGDRHLSMVSPLGATLKRLDLKYAKFSGDTELQVIKMCFNLEWLEVRQTVGDVGLRVIGDSCRRLRKLRVERFDVDQDQDNEVTGQGLKAVARGCPKLEFLVVYAAKLDDESLIALSEGCPKLNDLRLIIVQKHDQVALAPVDSGVLHIMQRCQNLTKLALAMRTGCLTNAGLRHIADYGGARLKWLCLVCAGDDDYGLEHLLCNCPSLRRLELRDCKFTAEAFMKAFPRLAAGSRHHQLKYLWIEGDPAVGAGHVLNQLRRERLHIEVSESLEDIPEALFAYYSFRRVRDDCSSPVIRQLTDRSCVKVYSGRRFPDQ